MLKKFHVNFKNLDTKHKSMIYLNWIYNFWNVIMQNFVWFYIISKFADLNVFLIYVLIFFTSCWAWFTLLWYIFSKFWFNIKRMYVISYLLMLTGYIILFAMQESALSVYLYALFFWAGFWAYWNSCHTQEMVNIEKDKRQFYSWAVWTWTWLIRLAVPLIWALIFILAEILQFNWYALLLWIMPFVYAISFKFINNVADYYPKPIKNKDFKNFINLRKYKFGHLYYIFCWFTSALYLTSTILITAYILWSEIKIWLFNFALTLIAMLFTIKIANDIWDHNRIKYYYIVSILIWLSAIILWLFINIYLFLVFSIIQILLHGSYRSLTHVYDLKTIDNFKEISSDFYPGMNFRELLLWIWRFSILSLVAYFGIFLDLNIEELISLSLILFWLTTILQACVIHVWEIKES